MEVMEVEGKTIDEAIGNACSAFQVSREKLNIEIISEGSSGFLGIGAKKAQIRASLLSIDRMLDAPFDRPAVKPKTNELSVHVSGPASKRKAAKVPEVQNQAEREERKINPPAPAVRPTPVVTGGNDEPAKEKAKRILEGLLTRMQIDSPVSAEETEEAIILNIKGDGSGLLIGKRGQNLDAIQYIVNKAVHHSVNGHKMIIIDTEAYRERREESLVAMAMKLGEKVKRTKKPVTVGHMNAHDRRIIHMAIQNDATLTTKSRGEGEYRKILILPARKGPENADA
ncbi:MAG: RNA-binding cell elongation regulator Jag/EloR [Syntrophales bacterium]|nr:RNA-binding cell elongation regulator Jag/EloR [Syntrophales bacterium]